MFTLVHSNLTQETVAYNDLIKRAPLTLLYFYPKDDTPGCTLEAQEFTSLTESFQNKWVQIIGISKDSPNTHCSFISKYKLTPLYLSDPELNLHKQFGARWEKNNYWKIVQWVIRSTFLINHSWEIIKERKNVRATGHAEKVSDRIEKNL
jgi:peroxiredoxin Q/BCP